MTISRGQMNRQLYMGGGIMDIVPREPAIFGGIKKAVKKVTKGVKDIAKSDLGKAALLYAGTAGLGSLAAGKGFGSLMQLGTYAPSTVLGNLGIAGTNFFKGKAMGVDKFDNIVRSQSGLSKALSSIGLGGGGEGMGNIGKLATLGVVSTFLTKTLGMPPEQAEEEVARDPSKYLELYYRNLNPPTADTNSEEYEAQVRDFVTTNTSEYAEGGRIGFDNGSPREFDPSNFRELIIQDMIKKSPDGIVMDGKRDTSILDSLRDGGAKTLDPSFPPVEYDDGTIYYPETDEYYKIDGTQVDGISPGAKPVPKVLEAAEGGRIGYSKGTGDSQEGINSLKPLADEQARVQYELPFGEPLFVVKQAGRFFGVFEQKDGSRILLPMDKSGSRLDLANAGPVLPPDTTQPVNPFGPKPGDFGIDEDIPIKMASNEISIDKIEMLIKRGADNDLIKEFTGASDGVIDQIRDAMKRKNKAGGGIMNRMNYALGDTASQNAMQAAGIEGLPIRQNPKGVKELDLRDSGGFIPPVGIKEKEDDIPAMLSNNEFVFTADAVRGMGDGDVELGAQRMYDQMKMLEAGGRV